MDDPAIGYTTFRDCLRDLAIINFLTLAYRPTLKWLRCVTKKIDPHISASILDIGSGGGDMLRRIARWTSVAKRKVSLTGVDLNPWSKQYAASLPATQTIIYETTDIFDFAPARRADFIISSLFTHHLSDEQLVRFLQWMEQHAARGWFINDLHRHPLPYALIKYGTRLFGFHYMVQHDGPISVARAFTRADWRRALTLAKIPLDQVDITWFFPFRYGVARHKT